MVACHGLRRMNQHTTSHQSFQKLLAHQDLVEKGGLELLMGTSDAPRRRQPSRHVAQSLFLESQERRTFGPIVEVSHDDRIVRGDLLGRFSHNARGRLRLGQTLAIGPLRMNERPMAIRKLDTY